MNDSYNASIIAGLSEDRSFWSVYKRLVINSLLAADLRRFANQGHKPLSIQFFKVTYLVTMMDCLIYCPEAYLWSCKVCKILASIVEIDFLKAPIYLQMPIHVYLQSRNEWFIWPLVLIYLNASCWSFIAGWKSSIVYRSGYTTVANQGHQTFLSSFEE
jgi:hypothetical protein